MAFINQKPRYSRTDGDRGFVFCTIPAFPTLLRGSAPGRSASVSLVAYFLTFYMGRATARELVRVTRMVRGKEPVVGPETIMVRAAGETGGTSAVAYAGMPSRAPCLHSSKSLGCRTPLPCPLHRKGGKRHIGHD